jgi:5-methylcytosine-specific restriction endonuclease McrA
MLLPMLRDGRLHLSGVARLVPHLTAENRDAVLTRAAGLSHRQVRELVAELEPRPDAPASIRKVPGRTRPTTAVEPPELGAPRVESARGGPPSAGVTLTGGESESAPALDPSPLPVTPRATVEPLAPARFKVQFTASAELRDKLERLHALMRRSAPDADLGKVIDVAVTRELQRLEARRFAKTKKPRKRLAQTDTRAKSRYIPAAVRRLVEKRDEGRCTYRDRHGRRCSKSHDLEFHHRKPFGLGGDHSPEGLALMCRRHNALLAEEEFGKEKMARHRRRGRSDARSPGAVEMVSEETGSGTAEAVCEAPGSKRLRARWRSPG